MQIFIGIEPAEAVESVMYDDQDLDRTEDGIWTNAEENVS